MNGSFKSLRHFPVVNTPNTSQRAHILQNKNYYLNYVSTYIYIYIYIYVRVCVFVCVCVCVRARVIMTGLRSGRAANRGSILGRSKTLSLLKMSRLTQSPISRYQRLLPSVVKPVFYLILRLRKMGQYPVSAYTQSRRAPLLSLYMIHINSFKCVCSSITQVVSNICLI